MEQSKLKARAALFSVVSNIILVILKLIVGFLTGSVSIISEAIHSFTDLLASAIAFFSVKKSSIPADGDHQYGHGKYEDLSGLFEGVLILLASAFIFYEATIKIIHNNIEVTNTTIGIIVMAVSAIMNTFVSKYLLNVAKKTDSIALLADSEHLKIDIYTSLGVLLGLALIKFTHINILDPIIAILVALVILRAGFKLSFISVKNLLDSSLPDEEKSIIDAVTNNYIPDEVVNISSLKTRKSGSERLIELHIIIPKHLTVENSHNLCDKIEEDLKLNLKNSHITIHVEPCDSSCHICNMQRTCK